MRIFNLFIVFILILNVIIGIYFGFEDTYYAGSSAFLLSVVLLFVLLVNNRTTYIILVLLLFYGIWDMVFYEPIAAESTAAMFTAPLVFLLDSETGRSLFGRCMSMIPPLFYLIYPVLLITGKGRRFYKWYTPEIKQHDQ